MEYLHFTENYLADAVRLAQHFAERYNGTISEGVDSASYYPNPTKTGEFPSLTVRRLRVDCKDRVFFVAFVDDADPPAAERKYRNKSLYRVLVGEQIKEARERRGLTLDEVSGRSGFRIHSLQRIEEGRWDYDIAQLGVILDAIGASVKIE